MSGQEQNINELKKVRLEKLQELRDMGIDPFGGKYERSAMAQQIIDDFNALEGKSVKIAVCLQPRLTRPGLCSSRHNPARGNLKFPFPVSVVPEHYQ